MLVSMNCPHNTTKHANYKLLIIISFSSVINHGLIASSKNFLNFGKRVYIAIVNTTSYNFLSFPQILLARVSKES